MISNIRSNVYNQTISFGIRAISEVLIVVFIANFTSTENLGVYSFAITFSLFSRLLLDMGLGMYIVREVAARKEMTEKIVGSTFVLYMLIAPFILLFFTGSALLSTDDPLKAEAVSLVLIGFIFVAFSSIINAVFLAYSKLKYTSYTTVIQELIFLFFSLLLLTAKYDFILIFYVYAFARLVSLIFGLFWYKKNIGNIRLYFDINFFKNLWVECKPFLYNFLLSAVYARFVVIFINFYLGDRETGIFEVAFMIAMKGIFFAQIVTKSMFPDMSQLHSVQNHESFKQLSTHLLNVLCFISFILFVISFYFSNDIVGVFFGFDEYKDAIVLAQILSFGILIKVFNVGLSDILTTSFKQELRTKSIFIGSLVNILSILLLVPKYGLIGASCSLVLTELAIFIILFYYNDKILRYKSLKNLTTIFFTALIVFTVSSFKEFNFIFKVIFSIILIIFISWIYRRDFLKKDLI